MARINLRDYYQHYQADCFIDVDDAVADLLKELDRKEASYQRYVRRYKAYYSLDVDNGIHRSILLAVAAPEEIYEQEWMTEELYKAIDSLPKNRLRGSAPISFLGLPRARSPGSRASMKAASGSPSGEGLRGLRIFWTKPFRTFSNNLKADNYEPSRSI